MYQISKTAQKSCQYIVSSKNLIKNNRNTFINIKNNARWFSDKKEEIKVEIKKPDSFAVPQKVVENKNTNHEGLSQAIKTEKVTVVPGATTTPVIEVIIPKPSASTPPPPPPVIEVQVNKEDKESFKELKKKIGQSPPLMGTWLLLGAACFAGAAMYYYNESDHYARKVDPILKMIASNDKEVKRNGLIALEHSLYLEERLFSRSIAIPQPKSVLIERGVVSSLLNALNEDDKQIKQMALAWLIHFSDNAVARKETAAGVNSIISTLGTTPIGSPLWITCSSLLLKLSASPDSRVSLTTPAMSNVLSYMYKSNHPLGTLMAGSIGRAIAYDEIGGMSTIDASGIPREELGVLTTSHCVSALNSAIRSAVPREFNTFNPIFSTDTLMHLNWALLFSIFGSLYGKARWTMRARMSGLSGAQLWKFVNKRSKTGRYVFLLLCMDLFSQAIMSVPPEGVQVPYTNTIVKVPRYVGDLPMSTVIPITEAAAFISVALFAIRYQRYVVLPVFLASTIAHWDTIQKYTKPYQEQLGIRQYLDFDLPNYLPFAKSASSIPSDRRN